MRAWVSENSAVVEGVLKQLGIKKDETPVLLLQPKKLYKLKLLENPKKVENTEGYMVKVRSDANNTAYILFLQKFLASKFIEVKAKKNDVLAVINMGKNMQTGYDYVVARWNKSLNRYISNVFKRIKKEKKSTDLSSPQPDAQDEMDMG